MCFIETWKRIYSGVFVFPWKLIDMFVVRFGHVSGQTTLNHTPGRRQPHIYSRRVNAVSLGHLGSRPQRSHPIRFHYESVSYIDWYLSRRRNLAASNNKFRWVSLWPNLPQLTSPLDFFGGGVETPENVYMKVCPNGQWCVECLWNSTFSGKWGFPLASALS